MHAVIIVQAAEKIAKKAQGKPVEERGRERVRRGCVRLCDEERM